MRWGIFKSAIYPVFINPPIYGQPIEPIFQLFLVLRGVEKAKIPLLRSDLG